MSAWGTDVPPDASTGVFVVSGSIKIDAPIDKVWSILLDFKSYREWNPFVRDQKLVDSSSTPLPDSEQTPSVGKNIYMYPVHLPPTMSPQSSPFRKNSVLATITHLNPTTHRVAWRLCNFPRFLLDAERWQMLTEEEDGKTKYESYEVFKGLLAYVVYWFVGANLKLGVDAMGEGLKQRAEGSR